MIALEKMVQKSVRLPAELVEYVNAQPGCDFTNRLTRVLAECKGGELERKLMLQRYDEQIAERRGRLDALVRSINRVTLISRRVDALVGEVDSAERGKPDAD